MTHIRLKIYLIFILVLTTSLKSQSINDSINDQKWNFHFQTTTIFQNHPSFRAKYSGINSMNSESESTVSVTGTLYAGVKLWKNASVYYNLEMGGGSGFSQARGIAGFSNGEVYRVSDPTPKIYTARFFFKQLIPLSETFTKVDDGINQLACNMPLSYITVNLGKFSILDFFDINKNSHDPRTQFYNWALMGNGAWDYPADTRGYTSGAVLEFVKPQYSLRFSSVMVPTTANGAVMDNDILHANSESLEFEQHYRIGKQQGIVRLISYFTSARMGNYKAANAWGTLHNSIPVIDSTNAKGRIKFGFGLNIEHNLSESVGLFLRAGWNDGQNETWCFTEIDRTVSIGLHMDGKLWKRNDDTFGFAIVSNELSNEHRDYLKAGGYGFIIGDGHLNYSSEILSEIYYSIKLKHMPLWISPDYQLILNPAYNKDRGPIHAFGIRSHVEF